MTCIAFITARFCFPFEIIVNISTHYIVFSLAVSCLNIDDFLAIILCYCTFRIWCLPLKLMNTFCESVTMLKCNINNHKSDCVQKGFKGFSNIINQRVPYVQICITFKSRSSAWRMIRLGQLYVVTHDVAYLCKEVTVAASHLLGGVRQLSVRQLPLLTYTDRS